MNGFRDKFEATVEVEGGAQPKKHTSIKPLNECHVMSEACRDGNVITGQAAPMVCRYGQVQLKPANYPPVIRNKDFGQPVVSASGEWY